MVFLFVYSVVAAFLLGLLASPPRGDLLEFVFALAWPVTFPLLLAVRAYQWLKARRGRPGRRARV